MGFYFGNETTREELARWQAELRASGSKCCDSVIRACQFVQDNRSLKNVLAKLERLQLAVEQAKRALYEAQHHSEAWAIEFCSGLLRQLMEQYDPKFAEGLAHYDAERRAVYDKAKSWLRKRTACEGTLKALDRLRKYQLLGAAQGGLDTLYARWKDLFVQAQTAVTTI